MSVVQTFHVFAVFDVGVLVVGRGQKRGWGKGGRGESQAKRSKHSGD